MDKTKILILEDEALIALDLKEELEDLGYIITGLTSSGEEALRSAHVNRPDIALIDIVIEGKMDGIDIAIKTDGRIFFINPAAEKLLGSNRQALTDKKLDDVLVFLQEYPEKKYGLAGAIALSENKVTAIQHRTLITKNGENLPVDELAAPMRDAQGLPIGAICVLRNARERLFQESRLSKSEQTFRNVFEFAPLGMALIGINGQFLQVNDSLCRLLGYTKEKLIGMPHEALMLAEDLLIEQSFLSALLTLEKPVVHFEQRYWHHDSARIVWTLVNVSLIEQLDQPLCYLFQILDVTAKKETELQLSQLAYFDQLTGLANRAQLYNELDKRLHEAKQDNIPLALVFIDLDGFKHINDSLGHEAGDTLLKEIAKRLKYCVRESDFASRLGGDEFLLIISHAMQLKTVVDILTKLSALIVCPIKLDSQEVIVTPSIGISLYPEDGQDRETLIRCADMALYDAKAAGKNQFKFFRTELTTIASNRLEMETALRKAVALVEFIVDFQPIVCLKSLSVTGFEALIRWNRPTGLLPPLAFIRLAEEAGLIQAIGLWVLEKACQVANTWPQQYTVNVNCSALQFREFDFVSRVEQALKESGLAPQRLLLELTEDILLHGDNAQIERLTKLRTLGVRLSIDDYGTGYSSLAYIKRYSPESLKIDKMFVDDLDTNANSAAIVSATIMMAHSLGMTVVAEGVERFAQVDLLSRMGCDQAQGFFFSKPLSAVKATELSIKNTLTLKYDKAYAY